MRIRRKVIALALASALSLAAFAAGQSPGKDSKAVRVTVGDFAVMLAAGGKTGKSLEAKAAVDSLVRAGVPLGDAGAVLNEAKLAEIMAYYGLRARTSAPDRAVSPGKAQAAVQLVSAALDKGRGPASGGDAGTLPQGVEQCTSPDVSKNHGSCVNCCKDLGGKASFCANLCFAINKGSADEPLP